MCPLDLPLQRVVFGLCQDVDTPRSLAVYLLLRAGDLEQAVKLPLDPNRYVTSEEYFRDAVCTELLRKIDLEDSTKTEQLKAECWARFERTERQCYSTNVRMSRFLNGGPFHPGDLRLLEFIQEVRKNIRYIVGRLPASLDAAFGPGATLTTPARYSTVPDKLSSVPSGTREALFLYNLLFKEGGWERALSGTHNKGAQVEVRGNRFFTVPKDFSKLRGACLSPSVNGYLQLGVGSFLKRRLRRVGIRLGGSPLVNTPTEHQVLAKRASRDGTLATIDLSDASNTVSLNLVRLLWPDDWFSLLAALREPFVQRPDGKWQRLEMLSAMGNGFTFEVETITFFAIAQALTKGQVSVFGDDIIVPTTDASDVLAALRWCGFSVNEQKTFTTGKFRESCGGDFFDGDPVRCHYVKKQPTTPAEWVSLANGIHRMAFGDPHTEHRWSYLRGTWRAVMGALPNHLRHLRGPSALGDLVIHDNHARPYRVKHGIMYWRCLTASTRGRLLSKWPTSVQMSAALYGVASGRVHSRDAPKDYRIRLVPWTL